MKFHKKALCRNLLTASLSLSLGFSTLATSFSDTSGHWGSAYINTAVEAGLMSGTGSNTFSPDKSLTYGEIAVVIVNGAFGGNSMGKATDTHWADQYLNVLFENNLMQTSKDTPLVAYASPTNNWQNEPVPRRDLAVMISRLMDTNYPLGVHEDISDFADVPSTANYFIGDIARVCNAGIMSGVSATEFGMVDDVTRAALCVVLTKLIEEEIFLYPNVTLPNSTPSTSTTPSTGSTTTAPSTGSTTTVAKPTNIEGTAPVISTNMGTIARYPDDVVAGSGQYDVNQYTVPADTNKDGWLTYREVATVWEEIYEQYPHRSSWDNTRYYKTNHPLFRGASDYYACAAFAAMCSDLIFGDLPSRLVTATATSDPKEVIRPGDVNYMSGMNHWAIVGGDAYLEGWPALEGSISSHSGNSNDMAMYGYFGNTYEEVKDLIASQSAIYYTRYPRA